MKITIISVGKASSPEITSLIHDYEKRLGSFNIQLMWSFIKSANPSLPHEKRLSDEAASILKAIPHGSYPILLDEKGEQLSSIKLSNELDGLGTISGHICIIIGGSYGVSPTVAKNSKKIWSLSKLTLPHLLVRLVIVEQLYRSYSIINGGKYHHE